MLSFSQELAKARTLKKKHLLGTIQFFTEVSEGQFPYCMDKYIFTFNEINIDMTM